MVLVGLLLLHLAERRVLALTGQGLPRGVRRHLNAVFLLLALLGFWHFMLDRYPLLHTDSCQPLFYGPEQIGALIDEDPAIARQVALWDRAGSQVIHGSTIPLPLGSGLLCIQPVYLTSGGSTPVPQVRVIVSDGTVAAMETTLEAACHRLLPSADGKDRGRLLHSGLKAALQRKRASRRRSATPTARPSNTAATTEPATPAAR